MRKTNPCWFLLCLWASLYAQSASAITCQAGTELGHTFASGASWQFCAVLDDDHALELQELHYQAPGDTSRKVLQHLHLGQVLMHPHEKTEAFSLIGANQLGGNALKTLNSTVCDGQLHNLDQTSAKLCSVVRPTGLLAKYSQRPGLQGEQYQLFSVSGYEGFTFKVMVGLSEDGRIAPSVTLSGRASGLQDSPTNNAPASNQLTALYTWRMVFTLNGDQKDDVVEEFNFRLQRELGNRRPMEVSTLSTETFRKTDRTAFRGWRVKDNNGGGYYLDPQKSGYAYSDQKNNWAQFDIALTAFDACERHSRINDAYTGNETSECIGSLDDFVNGSTMNNTKPVLWYSQSRVLRPGAEDYPIIGSLMTDFELVPFDWNNTSPFEVRQ